MKVLIVDDNRTNRMIMGALLDEYQAVNAMVHFDMDEAEDGLIAVQKSREKNYELVFMDINMPNMDGIEASRIIRSENNKVMVIAVSTVDDVEQRRSILNNGAEDYVSKPVDADVFNSRLKNYISLIESRKHESVSKHTINLYTNKVFSRHTTFTLDSEDSLAEFWEFFLLNARAKSHFLSDVVRLIVSIVEKQMKFSNSAKLYIEESETKQYFTLVNIDVLPKKIIELLIIKNSIRDGYKLTENKISFELVTEKQYSVDKQVEVVTSTLSAAPIAPLVKNMDVATKTFEASKGLEVFDYMDSDDLLDLEEYADNLNSLMLLVGGGALDANDIIEMCAHLDRVSGILSAYAEVYPISNALSDLSKNLASHIEEFTKNAEDLGPMFSAFSNDLSSWIQKSFHTGAPSVDFMNDTIVVNCQTIIGMLTMDEVGSAGDEDFDDIFDF